MDGFISGLKRAELLAAWPREPLTGLRSHLLAAEPALTLLLSAFKTQTTSSAEAT